MNVEKFGASNNHVTDHERVHGLLAYLDGLTKLSSVGVHTCTREIDECLGEIRAELAIEGKE